MILKIRGSESKWIFFDKIDKITTYGTHYIRPDGDITKPERSENHSIDVDAAYIPDLSSDGDECLVVEIIKYRSDDNSFFERIIALQEGFLMNDEGKTIEKLA